MQHCPQCLISSSMLLLIEIAHTSRGEKCSFVHAWLRTNTTCCTNQFDFITRKLKTVNGKIDVNRSHHPVLKLQNDFTGIDIWRILRQIVVIFGIHSVNFRIGKPSDDVRRIPNQREFGAALLFIPIQSPFGNPLIFPCWCKA